MLYADDIEHANIIEKPDIQAFIYAYDETRAVWLDADEDQGTRDNAGDELDQYDAERIEELRDMLNSRDDSFISEDYFEDYARDWADDIYGLDGTGASAYFDYEKFADEYRSHFTAYEYDGVTYYTRG